MFFGTQYAMFLRVLYMQLTSMSSCVKLIQNLLYTLRSSQLLTVIAIAIQTILFTLVEDLSTHLMAQTIGLQQALALANTLPQMVNRGLIVSAWKIPAKLMTRQGVHAQNHREMVIRATWVHRHTEVTNSRYNHRLTIKWFACIYWGFKIVSCVV